MTTRLLVLFANWSATIWTAGLLAALAVVIVLTSIWHPFVYAFAGLWVGWMLATAIRADRRRSPHDKLLAIGAIAPKSLQPRGIGRHLAERDRIVADYEARIAGLHAEIVRQNAREIEHAAARLDEIRAEG